MSNNARNSYGGNANRMSRKDVICPAKPPLSPFDYDHVRGDSGVLRVNPVTLEDRQTADIHLSREILDRNTERTYPQSEQSTRPDRRTIWQRRVAVTAGATALFGVGCVVMYNALTSEPVETTSVIVVGSSAEELAVRADALIGDFSDVSVEELRGEIIRAVGEPGSVLVNGVPEGTRVTFTVNKDGSVVDTDIQTP